MGNKTVRAALEDSGVLRHVLLSSEIELFLDRLNIVDFVEGSPPTDGDLDTMTRIDASTRTGHVAINGAASKSPLPGFDFGLELPTAFVDPAPCKLTLTPAFPANLPPAAGQEPTGFQFWVVLSKDQQLRFIFELVDRLPGLGLRAATVGGTADAVELIGDPARPARIVAKSGPAVDLGPALLVSARPGEIPRITVVPDTGTTEGDLIALGFESEAVVFGDSGVGVVIPSLTFDGSAVAAAPGSGAPGLDPPLDRIAADAPAWRGIVARELDFYLPPSVPFFGGRPIRGYFEVAEGAGPELVAESRIPADGDRPEIRCRIECRDPTALGLSGLVPTLITASADFVLDEDDALAGGGGVAFAGGKPIRITATVSRNPLDNPQSFKLAVAASAQGGEGLIAVDGSSGLPSKFFNLAALMATTLFGETAGGSTLAGIAAAGAALSNLFEEESRFVLHGAELAASGLPANPGPKFELLLDYSVEALVTEIAIPGGQLGVQMAPHNPLRVRMRGVRLTVDPGGPGPGIDLDFDHARAEVENPGAWNLTGLEDLFDVLGSRSGRGSNWIEVDLGFKLDLGPVKVSRATLRATLDTGTPGAVPEVAISGLAATLDVPKVLSGEGSLRIEHPGFGASLSASVIPLQISAAGGLQYLPAGGGHSPMTAIALAVDLPVPIPLANSGFGLFGIGGAFAAGGVPNPQANFGGPAQFPPDPILRQLYWKPGNIDSFTPAGNATSVGFEVAIGTLPDFGFSFSAKAGLLITVPDFSLRFGLNGKVLQPAVSMTDPSYPPGKGVSFIGALMIDPSTVDFAVIGSVDLKPLLLITVPIAGHFPLPPGDTSRWYVHLGADGRNDAVGVAEGRSIGPITAEVLPDLLGLRAEAYVMIRGGGITGWPVRPGLPGKATDVEGFSIAFGFAVQAAFGPKPVAWAELHASLDLLVGFDLPVISGFGTAGGGLHLGPFSLGVEAKLRFLSIGDDAFVFAEVTGRIELFFFDLEATVTVRFGSEVDPPRPLAAPAHSPIDRLGKNPDGTDIVNAFTVALSDDSYRVVARPVADPEDANLPTVWPDTLISIGFSAPPAVAAGLVGPFRNALDFPPVPARLGTGVLSYDWTLTRLELFDVTDADDKRTGGTAFGGDKLPCAWQQSRSVDGKPGGPGDVRELVLFSPDQSFWLNRLDRIAAGDRVKAAANACTLAASAAPGWAIGFLAGFDRDGCHLPPDLVSTDPCRSRVAGVLTHTAWHTGAPGDPTPLSRLVSLPSGFSIDPAMLLRWSDSREIEGKGFAGHLVAPCLNWRELDRGVPDFFSRQRLLLTLEDEQSDGLLLLVLPRDVAFNDELTGLAVHSEEIGGPSWGQPVGSDTTPDGDTLFLFAQPPGDRTARVCIMAPLGMAVGVAGLRGTTVAARAAAEKWQSSIKAAAKALADAAASGPPVTLPENPAVSPADKKILAESRTILGAGRLYRLDVEFRWDGLLKWQKPDGTEEPVAGNGPMLRQLFFRTAAPRGTQPIAPGAIGHAEWLLDYQGSFEPDMIERFIAGYEPPMGELFRFPDDMVRVNFSQGYVPKLVKAYGYDLELRARRIDRPEPDEADEFWSLAWSFADTKEALGPIDQLRHEAISASICEQPLPGLTGSAAVDLETGAWYIAEVVALKSPPAPQPTPPKKRPRIEGRLSGTTFRTSRWRNPGEVLRGLGFATDAGAPGVGAVVGDLAVLQAPPAAASGSDQAFAAALSGLGLDDWPPATGPRLGRLWVQDPSGAWLFAGLMIESPEPIPRPGRLELGAAGRILRLDMGVAGVGATFDLVRDAGGFRLLFLAQAPGPIVDRDVGGPLDPTLEITLSSITPPGAAAVAIRGRLGVPTEPAFAGDP